MSKRLFGSQYRVEVVDAIRNLDGDWTTQDLEAMLPSRLTLPWSCVTKEIAALLDLKLIVRTSSKTLDGRIPYKRTDRFPAFWDAVRQIAEQCAELDHEPATVTLFRARDAQDGGGTT